MASYRRMRRHARQVRRAGMQPMMVINAERRPAPRRRRDPARTVGMALPLRTRPVRGHGRAGGRRRGGRTRRSPPGGHASSPEPPSPHGQSWPSAAKLGFPALAERIYAATNIFAAGGWLAAAARLEPVHIAAPASPGHRRAHPGRSVVGAPAPARESPRGTQTRSMARNRAKPSGWPARRSCPPPWTCGDGAHDYGWHAARPYRM